MLNWIFQILFSEILEVPVSIELGEPGTNADVYNVNSTWDRGAGTNIAAIRTSHEVGGNCTLFTKAGMPERRRILDGLEFPPDPEKGCANMLGEIWKNNFLDTIQTLEDDDIILRPTSLGVIVKDDIVISKRTVALYPELLIFEGLQGEHNRQKLAEMFLRPTTWFDYCQKVSTSNCTSKNDDAALRPPETQGEDASYFVDGIYTGHFRATDVNNCTLNPNCSGIFIDYP
mmetsp:Transcript_15612/g.17999  ORF Transcript_15612/g.17999 Transcript_15612/m.17999 type:complete len:230 (+) Transcript_15612:400-1089(+)